jgi:hypothetical protein
VRNSVALVDVPAALVAVNVIWSAPVYLAVGV